MADPDIAEELRVFARGRDTVARHDQALEKLLLSRAALVERRARLLETGDQTRAENLAARIERAEADLETRRRERDNQLAEIARTADGLVDRLTPEILTATLDGDHPVAMLPVRIETRFDGPTKLRVRVFPDQLHVNTHDPAFTPDELTAAQWYWTERWAAGLDDLDAATDAWRRLTTKFRPGRASYLVSAMRPANAPLDGAPAFPQVPARASTWNRPPVATALPDRFCVVGLARQDGQWVERFRRWGERSVPDTLAVGPDPRNLKRAATPGDLPVDQGTAWMHDVQAAREAGVLIEVEDASLAAGVERLVVLGVDWTQRPEQAAASLGTLLESQRYSGHLGFVGQGTATNNTSESRAGFTSSADEEAVALDPAAAVVAGDEWSAGVRLATALGLPASSLDGLPGATSREHAWSAALTDALWCGTAGTYITDMLDPLAAGNPQVEADLREFTRRHVFASGPLPVLRVGAQPYGVLPVVSSRRYDPGGAAAEELVHRVASLMRGIVWPAVAEVPHLRRAGEEQDVDTVLLQLLQRTPVPWTFRFRAITGPFLRKNISQQWTVLSDWQRTWTTAMSAGLGVTRSTRLMELTHGKDHPLPVPLVKRPDDEEGPTGYLAEIAALTLDPLGRTALNLREDSIALLEAMVAHSAVEELDRCALRTVADRVSVSATELVNLAALSRLSIPPVESARVEPVSAVPPAGLDFRSGRQLADAVVPQVSPTLPLGQFVTTQLAERLVDLTALLGAPTDPAYWLAHHREAVLALSAAPADELEWAFRGYLDLLSTRLDAWFTGLATARLAERRVSTPTGVHIGCWGFVEDLGRDTGPAAESLGFVHTPSLAHAASTALLRNGRLANRGEDGEVFDLQVTSERVRRARWLLEGVAQGQRLAALLGYRLERGLREKRLTLMRYQMPMRRTAPLSGPSVAPGDSVEVLAARDVVDGVALLDRWRDDRAAVLQEIREKSEVGASFPGNDERDLAGVIDDVFDSYDAVSDLLVAESVHQAVLGNLERSGAALAAHDRHGLAPELDFIGSPRSGATVAHRVAITLQDAALPPGWPRDARGAAEPLLDAWVAQLLGKPTDWAFTGSLVDAEGVATVLSPVTLADLGLGPLAAALATRRTGQDRPTELQQRIALALADQAPAGVEASLELHDEGPAGATGGLGLLETIGEWVGTVARTSPLSAHDFVPGTDLGAGLGSPGTPDLVELVGRVQATRAALRATLVRLRDASTTPQRLRALLDAVAFDGPDALPRVPGSHPEALTVLAAQTDEVRERLLLLDERAAEEASAPLPDAEESQMVRHTELLQLLLGAAQPVLPRWLLADPAPVEASLGDRGSLLRDDATRTAGWLQRYSLVRPELEGMAGLMLHAEVAGTDVAAQLGVVQLPHRAGAPWVALPLDTTGKAPDVRKVLPPEGSVALVLHSWAPFNPRKSFAGVLVDAWTETIPAETETTAVTFHYDAPGARAPQSVLLAVHPAARPGKWSFDLLLDTVNEAADLAKLRMLSSAELAPLGSFLPALYLADDYTHDVPSLSLKDLVTRADALGVLTRFADVLGKA